MGVKTVVTCAERILKALCYTQKTAKQLSDELFVHRADTRRALTALRSEGKVHRQFFHNTQTNKPDYVYSSVRYPPRYSTDESRHSTLLAMVGDWDATAVRWITHNEDEP